MAHTILIIATAALITLLLRALPFIIYGGSELPPSVKYLGNVLPPAIMVILVIYCVRNVNLFEGSRGIPEFISILVVAGLHLWRKNTLLSILFGTLTYMFLVQFCF
ncbi:MAG: AzlD domain-containing protein [Acetatifactor sp.]|nr:AzlD domain-containing protein [Acetatifactor sp.]